MKVWVFREQCGAEERKGTKDPIGSACALREVSWFQDKGASEARSGHDENVFHNLACVLDRNRPIKQEGIVQLKDAHVICRKFGHAIQLVKTDL